AAAWFLSHHPQFDGRILVIERDPSYAFCSTSHTHSCLRQQYSSALNIKIAQFAVDMVRRFKHHMNDPAAPDIALDSFGYMYLAKTEAFADQLRRNQQLQASLGAGTKILSADEIARAYPFYHLDDIILGSHNPHYEGYFDGAAIFDWWRRAAMQKGVTYRHDTVVGLDHDAQRVKAVRLASGDIVAPGLVINAAGPRAAEVAAMAGFALPVEPRRRFSFMFSAQTPLEQELPLTIDPAGVHFLRHGAYYLAGCAPDLDVAVAPDNFEMDLTIWQDKVWPALAHRVPAFEAVRVEREWVGHYAYNILDANAVIGPHPDMPNFYFMNGFSGHGLQQSPAMGRGIAEHIISGAYQTLDLGAFGFQRVLAQKPVLETAVI
ncbi:FAD-binding oxidoreductase, partial [Alphaproteobacteria bacterium]|nr:FAD-binding oxidoreductase [Alphaproteobacteria bacterium]